MEKTFTRDVPHQLGREEARRRVADGLPRLVEMLPGGNANHRWTGDTMFLDYGAFGQSASAQLEVLDDRVRVSITVRGLLAAVGDRLADLFGRGTRQLLDHKRT